MGNFEADERVWLDGRSVGKRLVISKGITAQGNSTPLWIENP